MVARASTEFAQWIKGLADCSPLALGSFDTRWKEAVGRIGFVVAYRILVINSHHITMATSTSMANTTLKVLSIIINTAILDFEEDINY